MAAMVLRPKCAEKAREMKAVTLLKRDLRLEGAGPLTVFAPVNAAFEALGNVTEEMEENLGEGAKGLMFHAVPGMMEEGQGYDTLLGAAEGQLTINGDEVEGPCNSAKVAQTVEVCNSIVHVVSEGEGSP